MAKKPWTEEMWRGMLTGELRGLRRMQRVMKVFPAEPRCKLCYAPFGKPGSTLMRVFGGGPLTAEPAFVHLVCPRRPQDAGRG